MLGCAIVRLSNEGEWARARLYLIGRIKMSKKTQLDSDESQGDLKEKAGKAEQGGEACRQSHENGRASNPKSEKSKTAGFRQRNWRAFDTVNKTTGSSSQAKEPREATDKAQPCLSNDKKQPSEPGIIKQYGVYFGAGLLLMVAIAGLSHMSSSHSAQKAALMKTGQVSPAERLAVMERSGSLDELPVMQNLKRKLTQLSEQFERQVDGIQDRAVILNSLQGLNSRLSEQESEQSSQIKLIKSELDTQYHDIQSRLSHLQDLMQASHLPVSSSQYLDSTQLPFNVVSIDAIDGRVLLSVRYNHTTLPFEKGATLAGWRLEKVNYTEQSAVFAEQPATFMPSEKPIKPHRIKVSLSVPIATGQLSKNT